jgi:hypothetical protein
LTGSYAALIHQQPGVKENPLIRGTLSAAKDRERPAVHTPRHQSPRRRGQSAVGPKPPSSATQLCHPLLPSRNPYEIPAFAVRPLQGPQVYRLITSAAQIVHVQHQIGEFDEESVHILGNRLAPDGRLCTIDDAGGICCKKRCHGLTRPGTSGSGVIPGQRSNMSGT